MSGDVDKPILDAIRAVLETRVRQAIETDLFENVIRIKAECVTYAIDYTASFVPPKGDDDIDFEVENDKNDFETDEAKEALGTPFMGTFKKDNCQECRVFRTATGTMGYRETFEYPKGELLIEKVKDADGDPSDVKANKDSEFDYDISYTYTVQYRSCKTGGSPAETIKPPKKKG
jgi:hypothetical protein